MINWFDVWRFILVPPLLLVFLFPALFVIDLLLPKDMSFLFQSVAEWLESTALIEWIAFKMGLEHAPVAYFDFLVVAYVGIIYMVFFYLPITLAVFLHMRLKNFFYKKDFQIRTEISRR